MINETEQRNKRVMSFLIRIAVILLFIGIASYFLIKVVMRNKIEKTVDDIVSITSMIKENSYDKKYHLFGTDVVVLGGFLPNDMTSYEDNGHYFVTNRFGGQMYFLESVSDKQERLLYFSLYKNPERYHQVYDGVSAYVILLTNLTRKACRALAQKDWPAMIPNFLGIEASYVTKDSPNNGLYNLSNYILVDNVGEEPKDTLDRGVALRRPLTRIEAKKACGCTLNNCSLALKFL